MSSLRQKLAQFQEEVKKEQTQDDLRDIEQLSLSALKTMPIAFGKAKLGMTFEEAFQDQSWAKWFVNTYENSEKAEHRNFLRFVALRVDESPAPSTSVKKKNEPYLCPSAQVPGPSMIAKPVSPTVWDQEEHQLEEILVHQEKSRSSHEQDRVRFDVDNTALGASSRVPAGAGESLDHGQGRAEVNPARLEQVCNHSEAVSSLGKDLFDFEFQGQNLEVPI